jgi:hypothetical protein
MDNLFKFEEGIVMSTVDDTKLLKILVKLKNLDGIIVEAIYTTPFFSLDGGGVIAVPDVGTSVLLVYDRTSGKAYYIASIVEPPEISPGGAKLDFSVVGDNKIYSERGMPQKLLFTNQANAGLKITRKALPSYINSKVDIDSENGKRISLNDSPNADWVMIRNEHGDGIVIASDGNNIHSERSIEIKSKGMQQYVSMQSGMNFYVIDGKDINIENFSTGAFSNTRSVDVGRYGNINLRSHTSDISIVGKGVDSKIFITTPKARIQIASDGSIILDSIGSITMNSTGNINLNATASINIAGASVNIKSEGTLSMQSGSNFYAKSGGIAAIDGTLVHLNSNLALPTTIEPTLPPGRNDYGE